MSEFDYHVSNFNQSVVGVHLSICMLGLVLLARGYFTCRNPKPPSGQAAKRMAQVTTVVGAGIILLSLLLMPFFLVSSSQSQ